MLETLLNPCAFVLAVSDIVCSKSAMQRVAVLARTWLAWFAHASQRACASLKGCPIVAEGNALGRKVPTPRALKGHSKRPSRLLTAGGWDAPSGREHF